MRKRTEPLPVFKYHPDPIGTGSISPDYLRCPCCGNISDWIYNVSMYGGDDTDDIQDQGICPWCIADGAAHRKYGVVFIDDEAIGARGHWPRVPRSVLEEVSQRTPCFSGWQDQKWFTCCNDAAAFLGYAGYEELTGIWADAVEVIREEAWLDDEEWQACLRAMSKNGSPCAYVFRCLRCGKLGGYWDCD